MLDEKQNKYLSKQNFKPENYKLFTATNLSTYVCT